MATKNECFLETEIRMNERSTWWISAFWTYSDCGCFLIECPVWAIWSFNALREYRLLSALYGLFRLRKKVRLLRLRSIVMNNHRLEFYHTLVIKVHASAMDNEKNWQNIYFCKNLRCHRVVFFKGKWLKSTKEALNSIVVRRVFSAPLLLALKWLFIGMDSQKPRFQITAWVTGYI